MELCNGDHDVYLRQALFLADCLDWSDTMHIARSVAAGLEYLHSLDEVHHDLKPKNILYPP